MELAQLRGMKKIGFFLSDSQIFLPNSSIPQLFDLIRDYTLLTITAL